MSSWLEVDFNGAQTIGEVDVFSVGDYPGLLTQADPSPSQTFTLYAATAFEVQYWNGSSWATVPGGSISNNNLLWRTLQFASITTAKIRVVVNAASDSVARIAEVEAWTATNSAANINWLVTDQLGTPRMICDQSGSLATVSRHDYLPFGEELLAGTGGRTTTQGYTGDSVRQKFTRKERDNETGLDYFLARYYSSTQGRFTSTDPLLSSAKRTLPQSWNRYGYTYNNPLRFVDPNGEDVKVLDEEALKRIRQTLPENIRDKVKLDKHGLIDRKGLNKIKSGDGNFQDLKTMVNSSKVTEVGTATGVSGLGEFSYQSVEATRKEAVDALVMNGMSPQDAAEVGKAINIPSFFLGDTLTPDQSPSGNLRILVSDGTGAAATAPQDQLVITMGHELYGHGTPFIQGKPFQHDEGGPVDAHIIQVENRTRANFEGSKPTPSHQQPKKPPQ